MDAPIAGTTNPLPPEVRSHGYVCVVGGEGRDYALVADAMRKRPSLRMAIVARPYSIEGIDFPENVSVFTNLPLQMTWRLVGQGQADAENTLLNWSDYFEELAQRFGKASSMDRP
ncbi:MAG: hypothetical protein EBZ26_01820 [Flavobacteriia bacterium]|nr:hypothetical protein [Flavobacteriia bacterium]